jgi:hypothetical protein
VRLAAVPGARRAGRLQACPAFEDTLPHRREADQPARRDHLRERRLVVIGLTVAASDKVSGWSY